MKLREKNPDPVSVLCCMRYHLVSRLFVSGRPTDNPVRVFCFSFVTFMQITSSFVCKRMYGESYFVTHAISYLLFLLFIGNMFLAAYRDPGIIPRNSSGESKRSIVLIDLNSSEGDAEFKDESTGFKDSKNTEVGGMQNTEDDETSASTPKLQSGIEIRQPSIYTYRECKTCQLMKPPLASHCKFCNNCVKHFDQ